MDCGQRTPCKTIQQNSRCCCLFENFDTKEVLLLICIDNVCVVHAVNLYIVLWLLIAYYRHILHNMLGIYFKIEYDSIRHYDI